MRALKLSLVILVSLVALGIAATWEAPVALVFGWIVFLARVLPRVTIDWPSIAVGAVATVLFGVGVQWLGSRWCAWKVRWSLFLVAGTFLLFAAGLAMIALVHQVAWMARDGKPLLVNSVDRWRLADSAFSLHELGIGFRMYHDQNQTLPAGGTFSPEGTPLHSWETHLLPYLRYESRNINFQKPWNGPENAKYYRSVLEPFVNGELRGAPLRDEQGFGLSHYAANSQILGSNRSMTFAEITDGQSTTILAGEVNARFKAWGDPTNVRDPGQGINRSPAGFGGARSGATFLMADGSVRYVSDRVSPQVLRALATPRGGEEIDSATLGW